MHILHYSLYWCKIVHRINDFKKKCFICKQSKKLFRAKFQKSYLDAKHKDFFDKVNRFFSFYVKICEHFLLFAILVFFIKENYTFETLRKNPTVYFFDFDNRTTGR